MAGRVRAAESRFRRDCCECMTGFGVYAPRGTFGAQFAEVHVDADVGQVHVARMTGVFAAGRILNAKTACSQFMGGMAWGISLALHEHSACDREADAV